jgi:sporulation protein YlmC with PRC-barrel domain
VAGKATLEDEIMTRKMRIVPRTDDAYVAPGMLAHLKELKNFMIADASSDIRGWRVTRRDGRRVGTVDDLVVETTELEVRYLEVLLDHDVIGSADDRWVLVPARAARIHDMHEGVVIDWLPVAGLAGAPRTTRRTPSADQERAIREYFAPVARTPRNEDENTLDYARFWRSRPNRTPPLTDPAGTSTPQDVTNA